MSPLHSLAVAIKALTYTDMMDAAERLSSICADTEQFQPDQKDDVAAVLARWAAETIEFEEEVAAAAPQSV